MIGIEITLESINDPQQTSIDLYDLYYAAPLNPHDPYTQKGYLTLQPSIGNNTTLYSVNAVLSLDVHVRHLLYTHCFFDPSGQRFQPATKGRSSIFAS